MQSVETHNESAMGKLDLEAMDFDELWLLHEELTKILSEKITVEKRELEKRLAQLNPQEQSGEGGKTGPITDRPRRKYPKVLPKYSNPSAPAETWSGRGKQPRWLVAALQSGHQLEEFRIADAGDSANKSRRTRPT
jgi:DNA-binding protein H-NS